MDNEEKVTVRSFVAERIILLSVDKSDSKKEKAIWRHAFAKSVCEDLNAWSLLIRDMPEALAGAGGKPSKTEKAAFMAIAAFAACGSNKKNVSLGQAAAALGPTSRDRFTRFEKSRTIEELWRNVKNLLRLISSEKGTGLDYGLLAKELTNWQFNRIETIRKWERDYYTITNKN